MRSLFLFRATVLLLLFSGNCLRSMADVEFACPVTKPAVLNFTPNSPFADHANLLGNEKLFTVFPGAWNFTRPKDHRYLVPKIVWGSKTFDLDGTLTISGRRLDAAADPLEFEGAHVAQDGNGKFITSSFSVPTLGCWEVIGHFHGADLKIVVDLK